MIHFNKIKFEVKYKNILLFNDKSQTHTYFESKLNEIHETPKEECYKIILFLPYFFNNVSQSQNKINGK